MIPRPFFDSAPVEVPCTITIEQTNEHFHAHVELDDVVMIAPGDSVRVLGDPVQITFGQKTVFRRVALLRRAGLLRRAWTRFTAHFEMTELYDISFTPRRTL